MFLPPSTRKGELKRSWPVTLTCQTSHDFDGCKLPVNFTSEWVNFSCHCFWWTSPAISLTSAIDQVQVSNCKWTNNIFFRKQPHRELHNQESGLSRDFCTYRRIIGKYVMGLCIGWKLIDVSSLKLWELLCEQQRLWTNVVWFLFSLSLCSLLLQHSICWALLICHICPHWSADVCPYRAADVGDVITEYRGNRGNHEYREVELLKKNGS